MVVNLIVPEKDDSNSFVQLLGKTQKLLRSLHSSVYNYEHDAKDFKICFHAALPLLVLGSLNGLYLWNFSSCKLLISSLGLPRLILNLVKSESPRIKIWANTILPQKLRFWLVEIILLYLAYLTHRM